MTTYETILKRRSIRQYIDKPVDREILVQLLKAAMAAPSACNNQPWEFIVVTEGINELRHNLYHGNYNAPAAIVVCGNLKLAKGGLERYWDQDCSAAIQNILIAATSFGLGTVWIGLHPLPSAIKPVSDLLNIPDYVVPLGVVLVGYGAEEKESRTQYNEKRIYWETYDQERKHRKRPINIKFL
jgi:nitroreductase